MLKKKAVGLEVLEAKKPNGTIEKTLKFKCPVCGRPWYSKGELVKKTYHSVSQIYAPPSCPHFWIEPGSGEDPTASKNDSLPK